MLPLVSHVEYVPRALLRLEIRLDRQTDERTSDRCITLFILLRLMVLTPTAYQTTVIADRIVIVMTNGNNEVPYRLHLNMILTF